MYKKQKLFLITFVLCTVLVGTALASNAPTSQFGFSGWPYRQSTNCNKQTQAPDSSCTQAPCPTVAPIVTSCPTMEPTQEPIVTQAPAPAPTAEPTEQPTQAPIITEAPTAKPTSSPVVTPTKTAAPTATKVPEITVKPTVTPPTPSTDDDYTTGSIAAQEENAFLLLNSDRTSNGRTALALDPELSRLARLKSCDMSANNYFAHTSPTLGSASEMLRNNGYAFTSVGENIAHHATVEKSQAAFMSSAGHRQNILGTQWSRVGVGVCHDKQGFVYVTQLFVR